MIAQTRARSVQIEDLDHWRGIDLDPSPHFKEWQHFVVFVGDASLLVNLSVEGSGQGRVVAVHSGARWTAVERPCLPRVRAGRIDARFDGAELRWASGRYLLRLELPDLAAELELCPKATPSLSHGIRLGRGSPLSWCLVPRLEVSGWLDVGGKRQHLESALAYHDHNWGRFEWSGSFAWEWGCAMPADTGAPWSLVFARMTDRPLHRTTSTSLFVLENGRHARFFRNAEVEVQSQGHLPGPPRGRLPAVAGLLLPDEDHDVPERMIFRGERGDDAIEVEVVSRSRGQLLVPSEADLRHLVRLNEVDAQVRAHGRIRGREMAFEGPGILEVVRG